MMQTTSTVNQPPTHLALTPQDPSSDPMNDASVQAGDDQPQSHTLWGLTPHELHDRFWASRGIEVVRRGDSSQALEYAELFLLVEQHQLAIFIPRELLDLMCWLKPRLVQVRLHDSREVPYQERVISDEQGRFKQFKRNYPRRETQATRFMITTDRRIALNWQVNNAPRKQVLRQVGRKHFVTTSIRGHFYDTRQSSEISRFLRDLVRVWEYPDSTIRGIKPNGSGNWIHQTATIDEQVRIFGSVWIGAGRKLTEVRSVAGPAILWDVPDNRPPVPHRVPWTELEPTRFQFFKPVRARHRSLAGRLSKRAFDIVFSLFALLLTSPLYPVIGLAIWINDGWPIFFAHRRETRGGKEFPCIKFRTMYKDSELLKAKLAALNRSDGPQFHIDPDTDPRVTHVGRMLRKFQLDELPQFINVLLGQMSVVGPRPSPHKENQFCPAWREARLSVKPGITGLWQVSRTREEALDFQEWIRYDLEYVQKANGWMDLKIIIKTVLMFIPGGGLIRSIFEKTKPTATARNDDAERVREAD